MVTSAIASAGSHSETALMNGSCDLSVKIDGSGDLMTTSAGERHVRSLRAGIGSSITLSLRTCRVRPRSSAKLHDYQGEIVSWPSQRR